MESVKLNVNCAVMLWVVLKVRNSANPSELQVLQGINKKMFLTPARIGLTSSQLSYEANWGTGHERFEIVVDEDVLKVSLSMCFYGGKWEKDATKISNNSRKIRTISRVKPLWVFFYLCFQDNPILPRLYLTGVFFFIMMYTGSNVLPIGR